MHLNALSYYADFFIAAGLIVLFADLATLEPTWLAMTIWVSGACFGVMALTPVEYVVHRWVYHRVGYFREVHNAHYAEPNAYIGAPPILGVALILGLVFLPLASTNSNLAGGVTAGFLFGYMGYMLVHHAAHYWTLTPSSWLHACRRHHALHHHHSEDCNFGIITSLWDIVFQTSHDRRRRRRKLGKSLM